MFIITPFFVERFDSRFSLTGILLPAIDRLGKIPPGFSKLLVRRSGPSVAVLQ
ncbi:MAG TPA: hypothetical protein VJ733_09670 [Candidatus Binatia bacterium]|nr:hypothetical protein [Candidatus Binatia bacterium]